MSILWVSRPVTLVPARSFIPMNGTRKSSTPPAALVKGLQDNLDGLDPQVALTGRP